DEHQAVLGAGDGAHDEQQPALGVDRLDAQVLRRVAVAAHATGHAHALEDATGRGAAADRTGGAVHLVRTVAGAEAAEAVTLHDAGDARALGGAGAVAQFARLEDRGFDGLAEVVVGGVRGAQFDQVATRSDAGLLEVALNRLGDVLEFDVAETQLHGRVSVDVRFANLGDDIRPGLHHGDGHGAAVLVPNLGHAELGAHDSLDLPVHWCAPTA